MAFEERSPLRLSMFPNVPPFIRVLPPGINYNPPLPQELAQFNFVAPGGISPIIVECVKEAGFTLVENKNNLPAGQVRSQENKFAGAIWDCLPVTEKEKDSIAFAALCPEVKINQFPGLFTVGRKDSLAVNYQRMKFEHGERIFDFMPRSYVVPEDKEELEEVMKAPGAKPLIVKPPNWFCGIGIKLINKVEDIPIKNTKMVVQEYIDNPFLIQNTKFDLRLYVLMTSIDPVKIYIFENGLVRFATQEYTNDPSQLENNFIHLTNYSVNKTSETFEYNEHPGSYEGHKWDLQTLWKYMDQMMGIDWKPVWEKTKEVCVKTVLCGQEHMAKEFAKQMKSDYSCYKLWGFDVMYDDKLKPWLLEVNNIPSLHINTLDAYVNRPLVAEMFNIVGLHIPKVLGTKHHKAVLETFGLSKETVPQLGFDHRLYSRQRVDQDKEKRLRVAKKLEQDPETSHSNPDLFLADLTPADVRTLVQAEEELSQCHGWTRVFPSSSTSTAEDLLPLLKGDTYSDLLLAAWEKKFSLRREEGRQLLAELCREGRHLIVPQTHRRLRQEIDTQLPPLQGS